MMFNSFHIAVNILFFYSNNPKKLFKEFMAPHKFFPELKPFFRQFKSFVALVNNIPFPVKPLRHFRNG